MRGRCGVLALALLAGPAGAAEINVRVTEGRIDLSASAAPVAEVLDRLSKQTGMKVVYEGSAPRQLVNLSLSGRTAAEAVVGLLEGLGLNYMLIADTTGARVQTLMMAGTAPTVASPRPASAGPMSRVPSTASASGADANEAAEEPAEEEGPPQTLQPSILGVPRGLPTGPPGMTPNNPASTAPGSSPSLPPGFIVPGLPGVPPSTLPPAFPTSPFPAGTVVPQPVFLPTPQPVQPAAPAPQKLEASPP